MTDDDRRTRALGWLKVIYADVQHLIVDHHIFWEVQDIIKANPTLAKTPSHFFQWMGTNFIAAEAVGVRRQGDPDKHAVSLRRLLEELKQSPHLFSRSYFLSLYGAHHPRDLAERDYDNVAGRGRNELDPARIQQDIDVLISKSDAIRHYVNKRIAHYDFRGMAKPRPTFNDLKDSLDHLESLVKKYYFAMKASWVDRLLPTFQYDWQEIFSIPWIERPAREDIENE